VSTPWPASPTPVTIPTTTTASLRPRSYKKTAPSGVRAPDPKTKRPAAGDFTTATGLNPKPIRRETDLSTTLAAHEDPVLTPPPRPARPPHSSDEDRFLALAWIMGGATSANTAAYFAAVSSREAHRPPENLAARVGEETARLVTDMLAGLAAEEADRHARLVSAIAELEAEEWTPEKARAALGVPEPRNAAAA
jgi:hypothetical protein